MIMGVYRFMLSLLLVGGCCVGRTGAGVNNATQPGGEACSGGETIHGLTGTVTSPRARGFTRYPDNMRCSWRIEVPGGRRVWLRSTLFNIEYTDGCRFDYLHVYDGEDATATVLAKLCGTTFPVNGINSSTNIMFIQFRSDTSIGKSGFRLLYTNIPLAMPGAGVLVGAVPARTECGQRLIGSTGRFGSPGFGTSKTYMNNAKCQWLIDAGPGKVVKLRFTAFDVEYSVNCLYDHVSVYDGANTSAPLIDAYCGSHLPAAFRSSGKHVTVVFRTDSSVKRAGFQASYSTETKPADHPNVPGCHSASRPAMLTGTEGRISSPEQGPKGNYPDKTICQWKVVVPANKRAHLHFPVFGVEPDEACRYDHVEVFDGGDVTAPSLGRYCGEDTPGDITGTGNTLLIQFRSDDSVTAGGFSAVYSAKDALGFGNANGEPACGLPQFLPKFARIVGGTVAAPHTWPWQVSLQYFKRHMCGSSIIAKRWVVTAAHCLVSKGFIRIKEDLQVVVGEHNLRVVGGRERKHNISRIIVHHKYNPVSSRNDIALLELSSDIRYTPAVLPVCLPRRDAPTDLVCVTTGWGETKGTADPKKLNQVRVPIIARATCRRPDWYYVKFTDAMICAGFPEGGKDSCQGDSGGPLVCRESGIYHLQGITSWGFGCARPKAPGIYTRVVRFIDWIERQTNGTSQASP